MLIDYYLLPNGRQPAREYIKSLDDKLRSKTMRSISILQTKGHMIGEPETKYLEDGIFELRTTMGNNTGRILFFFCIGDKVILTHGFVKKTQKTPRREIVRAKRYREDYLNRFMKG